ncbi:rhodanese-like domain-containing protein [Ancylobacter sp. MQZ15Z-1]|uniref:Rhodanese-like domain-containing protein n=1 Tax=Ancylobacter mangrovi TaxID=2972472 RepID=A0A9X2P9L1_9HYPH|nr:rhodanese-like domain-containing protein [Ancylobacter mangrovi]MCS0494579.1 rhodanese-like domain-containing protein [Ancylobacter mangrovi]
MTVASVTAEVAKSRLHAGAEIAFLDVREAAAFGDGHPLFAVPCPFSQLEVSATSLIPRLDCPILLIDDGDGLAERAGELLAACGYRDVALVAGGLPAWKAAGFGVFAGVNVPSKTLGELLEHSHHPRMIDADTLDRWQREAHPHLFFDSRPPAEYAKMRIAGARCVPNGELAHRLGVLLPDDATPIVLTCAGRTRGIVGALGLMALNVANPVYALENGTQGWALTGRPLDRGAEPDPLPPLSEEARSAARVRAARLIADAGLPRITIAEAETLLADERRSTFLFDLRSAPERAGRPVRAAVPVLTGQLVQATDQYVGVRHARLILMDDAGLRGALAALFLQALGFEVHILALDDEPARPGPVFARVPPRVPPPLEPCSPGDAARLVEQGASLLDLRSSQSWEKGRLSGARWTMRTDLRADLRAALPPGTGHAVLYGDGATVAAAALELSGRGIAAHWLGADLDECAAAGWSIDETPRPMSRVQALDRIWFVHDRHDGNAEASRRYLAWEMGLIDQLDAAERASFGSVPITASA